MKNVLDKLRFWEWSTFEHLTWEAGAPMIAALIAVLGVVVGFAVTSNRARLERRAHDYAQAIGAVSDYLEGPYRVARCHNDPEQRFAISTDISLIQGRIDASSALLQLHAPKRVSSAYDAYVAAARREAGQQMAAGWRRAPAKKHRDMNMVRPFDRTASSVAKTTLLEAMQRDMGKRWWKFWRWFRA